jgi:succinate-semialdehyde dehydrogenase / glutarate-semialdehyde dehydrogenase
VAPGSDHHPWRRPPGCCARAGTATPGWPPWRWRARRRGAAEVDKCALGLRVLRAQAERFLADEPVQTDALSSWVAYQPLGVVLAIMPWNLPHWQVLRFAAPALMAGNGALLKHSPNVPRCALAIEELFERAGVPEGLFRTLLVTDASVNEATGRLLGDPRVGAVTLTGSERAGAAVGATAGRALKKCVLELGRLDPFVVLADADLGLAAEAAARARFLNGGQSCIAAKRFVVEEPVADEFERRFVDAVAALLVGDPLDPRPGAGRAAGPADRVGLAVRQRRGRLRPAAAVRGDQAQRLRPRAGRGRHPRARQHPHLLVQPPTRPRPRPSRTDRCA